MEYHGHARVSKQLTRSDVEVRLKQSRQLKNQRNLEQSPPNYNREKKSSKMHQY